MPIQTLHEAHAAIASLSANASALVRRFATARPAKLNQLYQHHNSLGTSGDTLVVLQMLEYAARGNFSRIEWMVVTILKDRNKQSEVK